MNRRLSYDFAIVLVFCSLLVLASCDLSRGEQRRKEIHRVSQSGSFRLPEIPMLLTVPEDRAEYLVLHYWDNYPFQDSVYVTNDNTEQLFVDFLDLLQRTDKGIAKNSIGNMLSLAGKNMSGTAHFRQLYEKYLYDPNSPMRNEELYESVVEKSLSQDGLSHADRIRYEYRLASIRKNAPGSQAPDFSYLTSQGNRGFLSSLKSPYTLLFFYDPSCMNCRDMEKTLASFVTLNELEKKGMLKVLAVYTDDNTRAWEQNLKEMPDDWILARNHDYSIREKELYELRAFPTIYLLDEYKKIILKDASWEKVHNRLNEIYSIASL